MKGEEKSRFFGIGEPLIQREEDTRIPAAAYLDLIDGMGCTAYRSWMHIPDILLDPETPNEAVAERHRLLLARAEELDIEVTGMSHEWFLPEGCRQRCGHAAPPRDLTEGSLYRQMLDMLERSWATMASLFPTVAQWEVGNEWNLNAFLQPDGFMEDPEMEPFSPEEKLDIAVDMMYYAARGIRRGNPKAKVVSFSSALSTPWLGGDLPEYFPPMYGIAWTLDAVYRRIASGHFPSTNPDDYFDIVAWHPYQMSTDQREKDKDLFLHIEEPDRLWVDYSNAAYRVMCQYGDAEKPVIFTETGFTDCGDPERESRQADYTEKLIGYAAQMPYVKTVFHFRLLNERGMLERNGIEDNQIGGLAEVYFGMFTDPSEGCEPRLKARVIQRAAGGTGDLAALGRKVRAQAGTIGQESGEYGQEEKAVC